ncbi:hypothetical protein LXL04_013692 [Taraxacum kok-saghyz]
MFFMIMVHNSYALQCRHTLCFCSILFCEPSTPCNYRHTYNNMYEHFCRDHFFYFVPFLYNKDEKLMKADRHAFITSLFFRIRKSLASRSADVANKRPRVNEPSSSHSRMVHHARRLSQIYRSSQITDGTHMTPVQVDSDSDPDSDSDAESDLDPEADQDDGADGVAEAQHQHLDHHTTTSAATSLPGQATSTPAVAREEIQAVVTDPDMLHCSICHNSLCPPIYLCDNGHTSCTSCKTRSKNTCPSCSIPKGFNRCRGMDKLVESMKVECKYRWSGCRETLMFTKKSEHENKCRHTICFCPITFVQPSTPCNYRHTYKNVYDHFCRDHLAYSVPFVYHKELDITVEETQKRIVLREQEDGVLFILNHDNQEYGRVFNVECIGPGAFTGAFVYRLTAKCIEPYSCLTMESVAAVFSKWQEHNPKNYLTVPSGFPEFKLQVWIKKVRPVV